MPSQHGVSTFGPQAARRAALLAAALAACLLAGCDAGRPAAPAARQVIVLGFDGMDPGLVERFMAEGRLPELARLRAEGTFARLPTSNPPQSSVAWAGFATGHGPGHHGIFDFLRRDPATYRPDFSMARSAPPERTVSIGDWTLPLSDPVLSTRRDGEPFWVAAERDFHRAAILRVPVTWPPDAVTRMVSGLGVPDLLGTQGTYTLYSTRVVPNAENGGRVRLLRGAATGVIDTDIEGPQHPFDAAAPALRVRLRIAADGSGVRLSLPDSELSLQPGQWSEWVGLRFPFAGVLSVRGIVRFHLREGLPGLSLYMTPIEIDPREPAAPVTAPAAFSAELAARIGVYHTLGMPEETWALTQGHLDDDAWLDGVRHTLAEGEAMLRDTLERRDTELVVKVFVQTDRVSHMFWRGIDAQHPLHATTGLRGREAIGWIYGEADRIVGEVRRRMQPGDRLLVVSDHGFAPFRTAVNLNRWLLEQGWLALRAPATQSAPLFAEVDWSRTRAYALGLNGLYLNVRGREAQGIVDPADAPRIKRELAEALRGLRSGDGSSAVREVHDAATIYPGPHAAEAPDLVVGWQPGLRASWQTALGGVPPGVFEPNNLPWSGDHCIDPSAVPGVFFADVALAPPTSIEGVGAVARTLLEAK
ncbi:MAG: alkaline phosphatase family protein [Pseudomonadota bacterium]|jgi:predicted AlkP superfamily phosphohydrolase/phosphomutase